MSAIIPVIKYLKKSDDTKELADDMQAEFDKMQAVIEAARFIADNHKNFSEYDPDGVKRAALDRLNKAFQEHDK